MASSLLTVPSVATFDLTRVTERRQFVESALGTMAAENEVPCAETLADLEKFVESHLTLDELTDAILRRARK